MATGAQHGGFRQSARAHRELYARTVGEGYRMIAIQIRQDLKQSNVLAPSTTCCQQPDHSARRRRAPMGAVIRLVLHHPRRSVPGAGGACGDRPGGRGRMSQLREIGRSKRNGIVMSARMMRRVATPGLRREDQPIRTVRSTISPRTRSGSVWCSGVWPAGSMSASGGRSPRPDRRRMPQLPRSQVGAGRRNERTPRRGGPVARSARGIRWRSGWRWSASRASRWHRRRGTGWAGAWPPAMSRR